MPIIAAIAFCVMLVVYLNAFSSAVVFIYLPSLIFVIGCYALVLISSKNIKSFFNALKILVNSKNARDIEMLEEAINAFSLLEKSSFWIGIAGLLIGAVALLNTLDQPSTIGPNVALSLLNVFYCAMFTIIILYPGNSLLKKIKRNS